MLDPLIHATIPELLADERDLQQLQSSIVGLIGSGSPALPALNRAIYRYSILRKALTERHGTGERRKPMAEDSLDRLWEQASSPTGVPLDRKEVAGIALAASGYIAELTDHLGEMVEAVQWMSGADAFSESGVAHEGWKLVRDKLAAATRFVVED